MGIAILSGVIASLEPRSFDSSSSSDVPKWESHTPGTLTPTGPPDASVPSRFIACVGQQDTVTKRRGIFDGLPQHVEVLAGKNLQAAQQSDVVLLWYVFRLYSAHEMHCTTNIFSCKPQLASSILMAPGMKEALEGKLLISILAGVTISQITAWVLPSTRVIRAMPNTPCKVCTYQINQGSCLPYILRSV